MANYRNEFEFRSGLLNALGVEHTEADAKNEERWRAKMLDGLEVEYNQNDVNQFDLFRAKLVEGVEAKAEGGGGGSSDFSTAEVTVINGSANDYNISTPFINTEEELVYTGIFISSSRTKVLNVILYKGSNVTVITDTTEYDDPVPENNVSMSGDVSYDGWSFMVTGDCTITIS